MADNTGTSGHKVAHFRLPLDVHAQLAAFAASTERTMNGAAVYLLRSGLEREGVPTTSSPQLP